MHTKMNHLFDLCTWFDHLSHKSQRNWPVVINEVQGKYKGTCLIYVRRNLAMSSIRECCFSSFWIKARRRKTQSERERNEDNGNFAARFKIYIIYNIYESSLLSKRYAQRAKANQMMETHSFKQWRRVHRKNVEIFTWNGFCLMLRLRLHRRCRRSILLLSSSLLFQEKCDCNSTTQRKNKTST